MLSLIKYRRVRRTTLIALLALTFLLGMGLVPVGARLNGWLWPIASLLLLPLLFKKKFLIAVPAALAAGLMLGVWRGGLEHQALSGYSHYLQQKVIVRGEVVDDPTYDDKGALDFRLESPKVDGADMPGQIRIKTYSFINAKRGDLVEAGGKLVDGFGPYQAAIYFAETSVLGKSNNPIDNLRRQFAASVLSNLPEPQASLGLGFLIGQKSGISDELNDQMKVLGLTHIVVASGFNLTILVRLARRIFAGISKFQTAAVSIGLMAGFVAVTGFSPSMSRAALVTGLAVWAWYYGRRVQPIVLILLAAAITAGINPLYLWSDIGWWLSFLAFAGVLVLAPLLQRRIFGRAKPKLLGQIVLETICAQVMTLPVILLVFGNLSLLALPANILIVPLVPLAMLLTFIAGIAGILLPGMGAVLATPATVLLSFMTEVVRIMSQIPWASVPLAIAWPVMLAIYTAVLAVGLIIYKQTKFSFVRSSNLTDVML